MTDNERKEVEKLRRVGLGYKKIASILDISINTVKSFCRRNNLLSPIQNDENNKKYLYCSIIIKQHPNRKEKKFCSDKCRMKWWNVKRKDRKATNTFKCLYCGVDFSVYGNAHRKFCSHECYINSRFGV